MKQLHQALRTSGGLRRAVTTVAATVLLASFASLTFTAAAGADAPPPGGWAHHHRPHFIHPADFTGNPAFFPLHVPVASEPQVKSSALSVNSTTGSVAGARALPATTPAVIPSGVTFNVDTAYDTQVSPADSTTCQDSNNLCSLRAAVEAADNLGDQTPPVAVTINLPANTYTLTGAQGGEIYFSNSAGVTVNGAGSGSTTIASDGSDRVIGIGIEEGNGVPVALNGVTITGGSTAEEVEATIPRPAGSPTPQAGYGDPTCGGGIYQANANDLLELNNVVVSGNSAELAGGGICADGTLYAENTSISGNQVIGQADDSEVEAGAGLVTGWDDFSAAVLDNVNITYNTVNTGNQTGTECCEDWFGAGGGAAALYGSTMSITNSSISNNTVTSSADAQCVDDVNDDFCGFEGGGGLFTQEANVAVDGTTINNNTVTQAAPCADDCDFGALGGGVLNDGGTTMANDTVNGNVVSTGPAGNTTMNSAIGGGIATYAPLTVTGSLISGNQAVGADDAEDDCSITGGGGIFAASPGFNLSGSSVTNNTTVDGVGAGIVSWDPDDYSETTPIEDDSPFAELAGSQLVGDQITGNNSSSSWSYATNPDPYDFGAAGGVYVEDGSIQIANSAIDNNTAAGWNGGLWVDDWTLAQVQDSTIANNSAEIGGGLMLTYESELATSNVTIADNSATATAVDPDGTCEDCDAFLPGGGGVYGADGSTVVLGYTTISGNTGQQGAGLFFPDDSGIGTTVGTIIAGNTAGGSESDCSNAPSTNPIDLTSGGWNLSGDASCGLAQTTDQVGVSADLGPLGNNGGPAPTMVPQKGSPAIDAGGGAPTCPATDERGVSRPQGPACDVGAVEVVVIPPPPPGYWIVGADGGVFAFGGATFFGSAGGPGLNAPAVGIAHTPDNKGYWVASSNGGVVPFGDAASFGNLQGTVLNAPVVGIAATPDGAGYWLAAADGGIFAFGDAAYDGSMGGKPLNKPIVGIAATPDGGGYWLVASDGGIFSFGDAQFAGSMGGKPLNQPIVGVAPVPNGGGYWEVASDGGIFAFGDAQFYGSTGGMKLNQPIVGMSETYDGGGYYMTAKDGGIFAFGDAVFEGSLPSIGVNISDGVGIAST